ncbi:MAG TPA: TetR/AcrR family transcriptional regulator [Bdellovibrionales bacterium]|nr:TetR/AcrR family transcriptional regulator [Bdellovibrionales bacterium]
MGKGELTRQNILDRAVGLAGLLGLDGLTIGRLADELGLSRSGLFAHFRSKETLQIQVLENAANQFTETVIRPSLQAPRGLPRVQSLFEAWVRWFKDLDKSGGCIFIAAAVELDDRPGPVRDRLVEIQREWFQTRARVVRTGVEQGHFKPDLDCDQFSLEMNNIMLGFHYMARLLDDPRAEERARKSFRTLIENSTIKPKKQDS